MIYRRIIGDSPPHYGGKKAVATVMPWHQGECALHYEANGSKHSVRFATYSVARTAAIQAIFSQEHEIDHVLVTAVNPVDLSAPFYPTARAWLAKHEITAA